MYGQDVDDNFPLIENDSKAELIKVESHITDTTCSGIGKYKQEQFFDRSKYEELVSMRHEISKRFENFHRIAMIDAYINLIEWESVNNIPISTLSSEELDKRLTELYKQNMDRLLNSKN